MTIKVTVQKKILVNGQEYKSAEEMPEQIRSAYEKAIAIAASPSHAGDPASLEVKIGFNGREYRSVEEMPPEIRRMYEGVMAAVETDPNAGANAWKNWEKEIVPPAMGEEKRFPFSAISPIKVGIGDPASFSSKLWILGILILMLIAVLYFLGSAFVSR